MGKTAGAGNYPCQKLGGISLLMSLVSTKLAITLAADIFVFGLLVLVHEFGHFITAKMTGMRVDEFAIGFGPKVFHYRHGETLYSVRIVPLGGFNRIAGMDPDEMQDERSFNAKPIPSRMLVIIAGSFMNFVLPVLLYFCIFLANGVDMPSNQPVIGNVLAGKPAVQAGLVAGDRIVSADKTSIHSWGQFVGVVQTSAGKPLHLQYERQGKIMAVTIVPEYDAKVKRGIIGIMPQISKYYPGVVEAAALSFKQTYLFITGMVVGIIQMVTGQIAADVAGPIGVAQMAGEVAQMGIIPLLQFAAYLSINLGLINLLPVPMLDGGHVVTLLVEGLRGKPLSRNHQQFIQMIGFVLLMMLFVLATYKDISNLFHSGGF
jgi:regulator of sigma E protease